MGRRACGDHRVDDRRASRVLAGAGPGRPGRDLELCAQLERALESLARLPQRAATATGPRTEDRTAVFETCRALESTLDRCTALLEHVPRGYVDTRPAVARVVTLREAVADAPGTLAVRRP